MLPGKRRQRDRHDFCRKDEVGLDGACDPLLFRRLRIQRDGAELRFMLMCTMRHDGFEHFFRALVAEIDAANHEKRHDHPGKEVAEGQGNGQQNQELVAK